MINNKSKKKIYYKVIISRFQILLPVLKIIALLVIINLYFYQIIRYH